MYYNTEGKSINNFVKLANNNKVGTLFSSYYG